MDALPRPRGAPRIPMSAPSPPELPPLESDVLNAQRALPHRGLLPSRLREGEGQWDAFQITRETHCMIVWHNEVWLKKTAPLSMRIWASWAFVVEGFAFACSETNDMDVILPLRLTWSCTSTRSQRLENVTGESTHLRRNGEAVKRTLDLTVLSVVGVEFASND